MYLSNIYESFVDSQISNPFINNMIKNLPFEQITEGKFPELLNTYPEGVRKTIEVLPNILHKLHTYYNVPVKCVKVNHELEFEHVSSECTTVQAFQSIVKADLCTNFSFTVDFDKFTGRLPINKYHQKRTQDDIFIIVRKHSGFISVEISVFDYKSFISNVEIDEIFDLIVGTPNF
ncbi:gp193 [Sphingomonas phage PAU]|uniref:gp193 n=1 Tax=Sphingomonas phage PAU TaxID=1150991 RepID=UPI000257335F|nr:gp193 [Sphingomonas phage PAU]AFF28191.1 gp193 [Sphingomonas phage PAU]